MTVLGMVFPLIEQQRRKRQLLEVVELLDEYPTRCSPYGPALGGAPIYAFPVGASVSET